MAVRAERWRSKSEERMSLGAHLVELKKRLFISAIAILVTAVAGFIFANFFIDALRAPITNIADSTGRGAALNYDAVTQAFDIRMQIAFTVAIVAASPVWLYQVWAFLVPGLVRKEKQYAIGFLGTAIPLFLAGCAAGWYVMPNIITLMLGFAGDQDLSNLNAKYYYDFIVKLLLSVGIAFVLPVFVVLLNFVGVLSANAILKGWRVAVLTITVFTAMATPAADVISMFLLAIPMIMLYFLAAFIAWIHDRRAAKRAALIDPDVSSEL
ncbi:twin-arginine translocase subunit TatC [Rhodoglobus sp. NPDC076762]